MLLAGDFETTTNREKTEVWLSGFVDVLNYNNYDNYHIQDNIVDFFRELIVFCEKNKDDEYIVFFHNLKFDGSFIVNYLLHRNIKHDTFINDMGIWYSITLYFEKFKIIFRDSLKILNFNLQTMSQIFKCDKPKGETPLLEYKPKEIKSEWKEYIKVDINILSKAIHDMYYQENFEKFTCASEALSEFKNLVNYRHLFPILAADIDRYCRQAYKGGWVYVKDSIKGKIINKLIKVYDINSMYPSTMLNHPLPYDSPVYLKDNLPTNLNDCCFIAKVWLNVELKKDHVPTFQTKDTITALQMGIRKTDYIKSTKGEFYEFTLTNYDLDLIYKHYDYEIKVVDCYIFKTRKGIFDEYIQKYKYQKENAKTPAEKAKAKIMLNSLYGKFGSKCEQRQKSVYLDAKGCNRFKFEEFEEVTPNYVPLAVFITSISRHFIISSAQKNYKAFLYADTDSLHLIDNKDIDLDVDDNEFGKWALEGNFVKAKYLRAKLYIEQEENGTTHVKGAGMTEEIKKQVTFRNFRIGKKFKGKKATKQVKGGMVIYDSEFTIKKHDFTL